MNSNSGCRPLVLIAGQRGDVPEFVTLTAQLSASCLGADRLGARSEAVSSAGTYLVGGLSALMLAAGLCGGRRWFPSVVAQLSVSWSGIGLAAVPVQGIVSAADAYPARGLSALVLAAGLCGDAPELLPVVGRSSVSRLSIGPAANLV